MTGLTGLTVIAAVSVTGQLESLKLRNLKNTLVSLYDVPINVFSFSIELPAYLKKSKHAQKKKKKPCKQTKKTTKQKTPKATTDSSVWKGEILHEAEKIKVLHQKNNLFCGFCVFFYCLTTWDESISSTGPLFFCDIGWIVNLYCWCWIHKLLSSSSRERCLRATYNNSSLMSRRCERCVKIHIARAQASPGKMSLSLLMN